MYSHGVLRLGAVVAAMIATSGDESFVMLAMFPKQALVLYLTLAVFGLAAGAATDVLFGLRFVSSLQLSCEGLEDTRGGAVRVFAPGPPLGSVETVFSREGNPLRYPRLVPPHRIHRPSGACRVGLDPDYLDDNLSRRPLHRHDCSGHFLETHLWNHIARTHIPRVFLWTLGALLTIHLLTDILHLEDLIREGTWLVLLIACLTGIIPESGPHLVFVTLYAQGAVPFSVLLATSIVQDGHGMLPLLAHSRRAFATIKSINFAVGLTVGATVMSSGIQPSL